MLVLAKICHFSARDDFKSAPMLLIAKLRCIETVGTKRLCFPLPRYGTGGKNTTAVSENQKQTSKIILTLESATKNAVAR